jgi:hypothetical protein
MPACARPVAYVPRQTHECDAAVLVRRHLAEFLGRCEERAGPLLAFVKGEPWGFAGCGDFELGFVRDLLPQLRRRAAGAVFVQVARLLPLVHGPADGRGGGVAGGPRTAGGGLPAVGAVVPGPDGGAFGLRRAAAGRGRRAAGAGGDAGHAARREAAARPGVGRGLARGGQENRFPVPVPSPPPNITRTSNYVLASPALYAALLDALPATGRLFWTRGAAQLRPRCILIQEGGGPPLTIMASFRKACPSCNTVPVSCNLPARHFGGGQF